MRQTTIEIKYEFTETGALHVWALAGATSDDPESSQLGLRLKSRQTGRILAENAITGAQPLRCDLDNVDISEAFENGGYFTAIAALPDNPGAEAETSSSGGRETLEIEVWGWKKSLDIDFAYGLTVSGDFRNTPQAALHDTTVGISAKDGYQMAGEPKNIKLNYTILGQGPFAHYGRPIYQDGHIIFPDESQKITGHGDTWLELSLQVKVGKILPPEINSPVTMIPINIKLNTRFGR